MADAIDKTTDDTGLSEEVDTTSEEELEASFDDITFEDGEDDGSEEETESEAATSDEEETPEESDEVVESEDSPETEEPEQPAQAEPDTDRRKANEEAAARRIADKQAKQQALEQEQQKYLEGADDAIEQALRQLQVDAYNNRVMMVNNTLRSDINNVVSDKGISELIHHENPVIRESILSALDNFEALHVVKDQYGNPTAVNGDVRQYLHAKADEIRSLTGIGAQQQTKAKETQKKRTLAPPAKTPPKPKVDPDLAAFDEVAKDW